MAEKNNAVCSICGKPYHKCLSCRDSMKLQPWKMFTDTAEHYKVFQMVRAYNMGVYTKDEFKSKLNNIDLSDLEDYKENIKVLIKDVLKEDISVIEPVKKVEEPAVEMIVTEDVITENVETENIEKVEKVEKPVYSRKRNYKVNNEIAEVE